MSTEEKIVVIAVIAIALFFLSVKIVGAGERGVLLNFGAVDEGNIFQPGLHIIAPLVQGVAFMNVQIQKIEHDASAASSDLQIVSTTVALNYRLNEASVTKLYRDIGEDYSSRIIDPAIQESVKAATARYTAEELIGKRELVKNDIKEHLTSRLAKYDIVVEDISITNFDFSQEFNAQIEQKVTAEQKAFTEQNTLKAVQYQAQQKVAAAQGEADATLAKAKAEAEAIRITAEALKENPQLVQLETVKKWNGVLPNYMFGGGTLPFVDISKISGSIP